MSRTKDALASRTCGASHVSLALGKLPALLLLVCTSLGEHPTVSLRVARHVSTQAWESIPLRWHAVLVVRLHTPCRRRCLHVVDAASPFAVAVRAGTRVIFASPGQPTGQRGAFERRALACT